MSLGGGLEGAHVSVIDAKERKIGRNRSERVLSQALTLAEPFTEERRDDQAVFDKLVNGVSGFTTEELQFLIAEYLQSVLPGLVYVTQVVHEQDVLTAARDQIRKRLHEAKGFTFMDYSG